MTDVLRSRWAANPYIATLAEQSAPEVEMLGFRRDLALTGAYDLVHMHWPEHQVHSADPERRAANRRFWWAWMRRLRADSIPVVRTRHNRRPHERPAPFDRWLLGRLRPHVRGQVWLTAASRDEAGVAAGPTEVVIPHGSYAPWVSSVAGTVVDPRGPSDVVRLATVGIIRPYKNVEAAVAAVGSGPSFALTVAGESGDDRYLAALTAQVRRAGSVELRPGRLDDAELVATVLRSDAVLIPYADPYNSGVLHLAMSLGRPVIVRDTPVTRELRAQYGTGWVGTYDGELTPDGLRRAWGSVSATRGTPRTPEGGSWPEIARAHADLYHRVLGHDVATRLD